MEFTPEVALAIFFAKLIDPIATLPAVVAGYFCRTWWQLVISAAAVGIVVGPGPVPQMSDKACHRRRAKKGAGPP
jgi:hypothetical protein